MKKIVSVMTIGSVILLSVILLLALFNIIELEGIFTNLLLTSLTIFVASIVSLNSVVMVEKKEKWAMTSLVLIVIATVLVLATIWFDMFDNTVFNKITWSFATISVAFNLIVNFRLKLDNRSMILQGITYVFYALTTILILLMINVKIVSKWSDSIYLLAPLALTSLVLTSILMIQTKKDEAIGDNYVKITKEEYSNLKKKIAYSNKD